MNRQKIIRYAKAAVPPGVVLMAIGIAVGVVATTHTLTPVTPTLPITMQPTIHTASNTTTPMHASAFAATPSWEQDFSAMQNGAIDAHVWQFELGNNDGWGDDQVQYYTNSTQNARIENGHLVVQAQRETQDGFQYTSARLTTKDTFHMQYGKLVFQDVRLPRGAGTWPALWLWPVGSKYSTANLSGGGDSGLANGEIDIMEYVGAATGEINASAHSFANYPGHNERSGQTIVADGLAHDYSLEWTPDALTFSVNDKPYFTVTNPHTGPAAWPYDQPYFLIVNLAMGGDWGGMSRNLFPPDGINDANGPWKFSIGAIRYYPLATAQQ